MKEKYTAPEMEIVEFEVEDVIAVSDPNLESNETPPET